MKMFAKIIISFFLVVTSNKALSIVKEDVSSITEKQINDSYKVKFDYLGHPRERKKMLRYLNKLYRTDKDDLPFEKDSLGIAKYDLNDDGEPEILIYLMDKGFCVSRGCGFFIFKRNKNQYDLMLHITAHEDVLILKEKVNNYYPLAFSSWYNWSIWHWNGKEYDHYKMIIFDKTTPDNFD